MSVEMVVTVTHFLCLSPYPRPPAEDKSSWLSS